MYLLCSSMSYVDPAIPQKREREVSLEAATSHPDDIVCIPGPSYSPFDAAI